MVAIALEVMAGDTWWGRGAPREARTGYHLVCAEESMFARILVPIDGTANSAAAVRIARRLAERTDSSLLLLRVDSWLLGKPRIADGDAELEQQVDELRQAGLNAHYLIQYGRPEDGIATTARYQQSDLIIMAPHRRDGWEALGHHSVTIGMLSRSPAPLLVLPEDLSVERATELLTASESRVLVPLDGSTLAERALPSATAWATQYEVPLLLVRVVQPMMAAGVEEREARVYLDAVRHRVAEQTTTSIETALVTGNPADEIICAAEGRSVGMIVMSTHGRGGILRTLSGSVAASVLRRTPVPLLIVPPGAQRQHMPARELSHAR